MADFSTIVIIIIFTVIYSLLKNVLKSKPKDDMPPYMPPARTRTPPLPPPVIDYQNKRSNKSIEEELQALFGMKAPEPIVIVKETSTESFEETTPLETPAVPYLPDKYTSPLPLGYPLTDVEQKTFSHAENVNSVFNQTQRLRMNMSLDDEYQPDATGLQLSNYGTAIKEKLKNRNTFKDSIILAEILNRPKFSRGARS